jgi:hypothetical protein
VEAIMTPAAKHQLEFKINTMSKHKDSQVCFSPTPDTSDYFMSRPSFVNETGHIVDLQLMEKEISKAKKQYIHTNKI